MPIEVGVPAMMLGMLMVIFAFVGVRDASSALGLLTDPLLWAGIVVAILGFLRVRRETRLRQEVLENDRRNLEEEIERRSQKSE